MQTYYMDYVDVEIPKNEIDKYWKYISP